MGRLASVFRVAKDGVWEMCSRKGDNFHMWLFIGKVQRGEEYGYLICFGPIYYIFKLVK